MRGLNSQVAAACLTSHTSHHTTRPDRLPKRVCGVIGSLPSTRIALAPSLIDRQLSLPVV